MSLLRTEGLVIGRGRFRAGPFELELAPAMLVAVIGPNGGGKTTLLKTLAGLLPPLAGGIVRAAPAAYLPPPGAIGAEFSAGHLVALGRAATRGWSPGLSEADEEAALAALTRTGVAGLAATPFAKLSSGQQQLVLMARLLVQEAPLCLLDEPTAMLDPAQSARIDAVVAMLAAEGRAMVVSTHRLDFAARCALVVAIGETVVSGPPEEMLRGEILARLYGAGFPGQVATLNSCA